jgi:hypothetical protein
LGGACLWHFTRAFGIRIAFKAEEGDSRLKAWGRLCPRHCQEFSFQNSLTKKAGQKFKIRKKPPVLRVVFYLNFGFKAFSF